MGNRQMLEREESVDFAFQDKFGARTDEFFLLLAQRNN